MTDVPVVPPPSLRAGCDGLVALLDLEDMGGGEFRGWSPPESPARVFGGQFVGQAVVAAGRTVPGDRVLHCVQCSFLRGGDPAEPLLFRVERLRDGGSYSGRRVTVRQGGDLVFTLTASFQAAEDGPEHAVAAPATAPPDGWARFHDRLGPMAGRLGAIPEVVRPFDVRYAGEPPWVRAAGGPGEPGHRVWLRADGRLPDGRLLHQAVLGYASDLTLVDSVLVGHGVYWGNQPVAMATLNHTVWFHRPFRADAWMLYDCTSPAAGGGRALVTGRFFAQDGTLLASTAQEALFRVGGRNPQRPRTGVRTTRTEFPG
jgi:acyl-CoA thioesterase II